MARWIELLCGTASLLVPLTLAAQAPTDANLGSRAGLLSDEVSHVIDVFLWPDRARVVTSLSIRTSRRATSEVVYHLPAEARVASFRVCSERRCRASARVPASDAWSAYPVALGAPAETSRRAAPIGAVTPAPAGGLDVRLAPLSSSSPLDVTLRGLRETELHGGVVSLRVPLTGLGARTTLRVHAPGLRNVRIDGEATTETRRRPGGSVRVTAELAPGPPIVLAQRVRCADGSRCSRAWVGSPFAGEPKDLLLVLDASDSMRRVSPSGVRRTIEALTRAAPPGSTVRVVAFGRGTEVPVPEAVAPAELDAAGLARLRLGNRSESAGVWPIVERWAASAARPVVVVVTDARLDLTPPPGLEVSIVQLSEPPDRANAALPWTDGRALARARGGVLVALGEALRSAPHEPLDDRLRVIFASAIRAELRLGDRAPLRAGESRSSVTSRRLRVGVARRQWSRPRGRAADLLAHLIEAQLPDVEAHVAVALAPGAFRAAARWRRPGLPSYPAVPGAASVARSVTPVRWPAPCDGASPRDRHPGCGRQPRIRTTRVDEPPARRPSGALVRSMRAVRPYVAACFAAARRGRANWSARFTYQLLVADRELLSARVTSRSASVDASTERCLLDRPLVNLRLPPTEDRGVVALHYPFVSRAEVRAPSVALDPATEGALDRMLSEPVQARGP